MALHIVVCVKSVVVEAPAKATVRSSDNQQLNPYDRAVLETALRMKEAQGGTVTALSMGPDCSAIALFEAKAMGADRMVLLCDPALSGSDTLATSTALGAALKKLTPFDLVLFGTRTADSDTGQVGPQTCVLLGLPLVTGVHAMAWQDSALVVDRRADGFLERFALTLPAGLTIHPNAVQPRDIGLYGIASAYESGTLETWNLFDLGLYPEQVGWAGSATRVPSWKQVVRERKCEFLPGTPEEQVNQLIERLVRSGLIG